MLTAGDYDSDLAKKWIKFCQQAIPIDADREFGHDEYTHYYYAQALHPRRQGYATLFPGSKPADQLTWSKYREAMFDYILSRQGAEGSWNTGVGPVYSTACCLTILQLDDDTLPIYRR